jgi:antitoxin PrlF
MNMNFTKLSSKGQVVIPKNVRETMKLKDGTPFMVVVNDETICLKKIDMPNEKEWERLTKPFKEAAMKSGFKQEDLFAILGEMRKKRRE